MIEQNRYGTKHKGRRDRGSGSGILGRCASPLPQSPEMLSASSPGGPDGETFEGKAHHQMAHTSRVGHPRKYCHPKSLILAREERSSLWVSPLRDEGPGLFLCRWVDVVDGPVNVFRHYVKR